MYLTEYELTVARDRSRAARDEMWAIRLAQAVQPETPARPSLLNRLVALAGRGASIPRDHRKVGAAA